MTSTNGRQRVRIAIIGAGFGGIGAAIRLKQQGYDDFVVFDRADEVGGTWRDNGYPGCSCDVPSALYSLSFAPNPDWSRNFSGQAEIWDYLRRCVADHDLGPRLRLGHDVSAANWDDATGTWLVDTSGGGYQADVLVAASGPLSEPKIPTLKGLETFAGEMFHSARWNHDLDLTGRRVAVIGTGASAIQFVPQIAPKVGRLLLFQRTPPWILPRRERALRGWERRLFHAVPAAQRAVRSAIYLNREMLATAFVHPAMMGLMQAMAKMHLRSTVKDPALREKLTPSYTMGCKRLLTSDNYYPALTRENVEVVTEPIAEVRPNAIVTGDGTVHEVDTIIFGTGFHATDLPIANLIRGRDGRSLADVWQGSMRAYHGTTVHGFPNLFMVLGPNTNLGHTSVLLMVEPQVNQLLGLLDHLDRSGGGAVEVTQQAQDRYVASIDRRMKGSVWLAGGCSSWYLDATGRNSSIWPGYTWSYRRQARRFDPAAYQTLPAAGRDGVPATAGSTGGGPDGGTRQR